MTKQERIKQLNANIKELTDAGFTHTHSVMDDCGTGGLFFTNYTTGERAVIRNHQIIRGII